MIRALLSILLLCLTLQNAQAASCDHFARKASTTRGDSLVAAYKDFLSCDKSAAEKAYPEFMKASSEVDTLVRLSLTAIRAQAFTPVWKMMDKIPDYSARDEVAEGVGLSCATEPTVITFLQGAYFGLRDIQFQQWDDAFVACENADFDAWLQERVSDPPASSYNDKYNTVVTIYVKRKGADSLTALERAAVDAATKGGPFNTIIEFMSDSVQTRGRPKASSGDAKQKLESALINVAGSVGPEQAALVADRLYNTGSEAAAATLLPRVYPDRVQSDDNMLYGAASIEFCEKQAVIHFAPVREPAKRWSILTDIEEPMRAFKPRLKCTASAPWPVLATPQPISESNEITSWVDSLLALWAKKGFVVKTKGEKEITLP